MKRRKCGRGNCIFIPEGNLSGPQNCWGEHREFPWSGLKKSQKNPTEIVEIPELPPDSGLPPATTNQSEYSKADRDGNLRHKMVPSSRSSASRW
jgi:hypothetical protein